MTTISTVRGDITTLAVDAIVNAANPALAGGSGVDGAIHAAGGPAILAECREIVAASGPLATGHAVATTAGLLPATRVIHTVGPIYGQHEPGAAADLLGGCYRSSLDVGLANGCLTVAFPNISTGVYGYPKPDAAAVAIRAVREWVEGHPDAIDEITFVCFDDENHSLYLEGLRR